MVPCEIARHCTADRIDGIHQCGRVLLIVPAAAIVSVLLAFRHDRETSTVALLLLEN